MFIGCFAVQISDLEIRKQISQCTLLIFGCNHYLFAHAACIRERIRIRTKSAAAQQEVSHSLLFGTLTTRYPK